MSLLIVKSLWLNKLSCGVETHLCYQGSSCWNLDRRYNFSRLNHAKNSRIKAFSNQKSVKRLRKQKKVETSKNKLDDVEQTSVREFDNVETENKEPSTKNVEMGNDFVTVPSRDSVLRVCTTTSGVIAALGLLIRQVSHVASVEGLSVPDFSSEISFSFEAWYLQLVVGLVILISSCRYLLLNTWPDFADSSEAANQQVLSSLQPFDYIIVALLPGISEELLFRGALLPIFGINLRSAILVGVFFGVLHLGNGRKYSFAIWATFVGFVYGYAAIVSSSLLVPMASHAANNLIGGLLWRYSLKSHR